MSIAILAEEPPACFTNTDSGSACHILWSWTHTSWLAETGEFMVHPVRVIIIVLVSLLARNLISRAITRMAKATGDAKSPGILRPFKEKAPSLLGDPTATGERRRQRSQALASVLRSIVSAVVFTIMIMLVLAEFNVNLGPLLASAGIVGLAIGFGAQALVKDIISGMFMLLEDQYGVGDTVNLGEVSGTVEAVGLRVTTVRDPKGALWYVRNGEIMRVGNMSQGWAVVMIDTAVAPEADIEAASAAIRGALAELAEDEKWGRVLLKEPTLLGVESITPGAITLRASLKTDPDSQWGLGRETRLRINEALRVAEIPAPLPDVSRSPGNTPVN